MDRVFACTIAKAVPLRKSSLVTLEFAAQMPAAVAPPKYGVPLARYPPFIVRYSTGLRDCVE